MKKKIKEITSVFSQDNPKIKKQIDKVKEKGHQRMTILVIPHGYDSSFHFQISHFTILFFLALTVGLLSLAIFGIVRSSNTQTQINQLSKIYGTYFDTYIAHANQLEEMKEEYSKLNENMLELFTLIDGQDDELLKIPTEDWIETSAVESLQKEEKEDKQLDVGRKYLSEIYDFRQLKHRMDNYQRLVEANYQFLFQRSDILSRTPLFNPMYSYNLTSPFGMRKSPTTGYWEYHDGLDMANATGTPIYASAPGRVVRVTYSNVGYGHHVIIQHDFGFSTLYGHCSRIYVRTGQEVKAGEQIAEVGATGNVTGPHLHYEIFISEEGKTDPEQYMQAGVY
ncbi:M23 family metallopeptidase [Leptospira bandrabouensis]|uniref:M23 family metallopeptidase n=1 Tax=Leptospira bandrabouensis TaxID=2484903 RepID=A0A6H3NVD1_9LEPT|nr:M23 family metallopeptidase [Leptospira bandrabouensis]MCG6151206.1 M23 family metallopeptidase [Leptospira bandrabouensis]TGN05003.1 M23 family metallopeptidase [Leptospira bandrabouensis]TGN15333.1 M23 family metallopeptidase [Leptospira bandrabouensis]